MKLLSKEEFLQTKKSNSIVIFGSGYSIKKITDNGWNKIRKFDSIGFNWFCHHLFGPTYFLVREQASNRQRSYGTEKVSNLYADLRRTSYSKTIIIISDMSRHTLSPYSLRKHKINIKQRGIILKDLKGRYRRRHLRRSIFKKGIFHGRCTLTNVIHIVLSMQYDRIIFGGIDLNNSRYFWLPPNRTRAHLKKRGVKSKHVIATKNLSLISDLTKHFKIEMVSISKKSLINKIIPYKAIEDL